MPLFRLETNLLRSKISDDFLKKTTEVMAKTLGKPAKNCVAYVIPDVPYWMNESKEPCGVAFLYSIGKLGPEENKAHSAALCEHIEKNLGIPSDRLKIIFCDVKASNIGSKGTTLEDPSYRPY